MPQLRDGAGTLSGQQAIGEQYVRICLALLVEDPNCLATASDLRRELFRLFDHVLFKATSLEQDRRMPTLAQREWTVSAAPSMARTTRH